MASGDRPTKVAFATHEEYFEAERPEVRPILEWIQKTTESVVPGGVPQANEGRPMTERIVVETKVKAPLEKIWSAYTTPEDIVVWNTASPDWHTTKASVDLRVGGEFSSRMEAKDGSFGFDFAGTYTKIVPKSLIEYAFGDRGASVEFEEHSDAVTVRVSFDPETENPIEMQRGGWQAILDSFSRHVESKG